MHNVISFQRQGSLVLALTIGLFTAANGQVMQFPGGTAPVIAAPLVQAVDGSGRPTTITDAITNRAFAASYNSAGQLVSLKSTSGRNAFDLRAISYTSDGRLSSVLFGNSYRIIFRYRVDGTQEIVDPLGGDIVRSPTGVGQLTTQSVVDPDGMLAPSLRLLGTLFSLFHNTTGLSTI